MTADVELLPLPEPNGSYTNPYDGDDIENYARANVEHHAEALRAEIERLRDDVGTATRMHAITREHLEAAEARAERLAEALRDARDRMLGQVKWVACDCGCERDKPADAVSVAWLRASALLRNQEKGSD